MSLHLNNYFDTCIPEAFVLLKLIFLGEAMSRVGFDTNQVKIHDKLDTYQPIPNQFIKQAKNLKINPTSNKSSQVR